MKKIGLLFFICITSLIAQIRIESSNYNMKIPRIYFNGEESLDFKNEISKISEIELEDRKILSRNYEKNINYQIFKNEFEIISVVVKKYEYRGGAHGVTEIYGFNFNESTGQKIEFQDIFKEGAKEYFEERINLLLKLNEEKENTNPTKENYFIGAKADLDKAIFYFEEDSVIFQFPQYELAPYSEGMPSFRYNRLQIDMYLK